MKIKNENYVTIQGWMINELGLKGNELMCYAIIYGFSQITGSAFTGSYQYLADWCNTSRRTIITIIDNLVSKNYIIKNLKVSNRVKGLELFINEEVVKKFHWGSEKISLEGSEKISPNNIDNNNNNRLIDYNILKIFEEKNIQIHELMGEKQKEKFLFFQNVIIEIYKSKVYKSYIDFITFEDIKSAYEKLQEQKEKRNIKSDLLYMKRVLLQEAKKKIA